MFGLCEYLPSCYTVCFIFAVAIFLYGWWPYWLRKKVTDLPGPEPSFLIGNCIPLFKKGPVGCDIEWQAKYGKVFLSYVGRFPTIHVADPDILKQITVKEFSNFQDRDIIFELEDLQGLGLFFLNGEHWKFVRAILTPTFSSGKLRQMVPHIHRCIGTLKEKLDENADAEQSVNIRDIIGAFTMDAIASIAFGLDINSQNDPHNPFVTHARKVFNISSNNPMLWLVLNFPFIVPVMVKLGGGTLPKDVRQFFTSVLTKTIEERKQDPNPRRDFLQLCLEAKAADIGKHDEEGIDDSKLRCDITRTGLTDAEIMAQSFLFMVAGYDTTATSLVFTLYLLALHPEWQDKVIKEIDDVIKGERGNYDNVNKLPIMDRCVSESLRMYPPLVRTIRKVKETMMINGYKFPAGVGITIPIHAIHNDPDYYPDPDVYDPDRFLPENKASRHPFSYLPFGLGPRNCIGMRLGQMEMKMVLVELLQQFRFVRAADTEVPLQPGTGMGGVHSPKNDIFLKVERR